MVGSLIGILASLAIAPTPVLSQTKTVALNQSPSPQMSQRPLPPRKRRPESLGIRTTAQSAFVADIASGSVLYAKDPHRVMPIASLTKLVTAMVFLDLKPDLETTLKYTAEDFDRESKPVLPEGERLTQRDVLKTMLVGSVNASANALARVSGGKKRFVELMNQKAKSLGLRTPIFVDPSGVDPDNRASAADVAAILATATSYPDIREIAALSDITAHGLNLNKDYLMKSTNLLLNSYLNKQPYSIIAAKTGSLPEAGYCMAQVTRNGEGHQIVVVELGSDNHFSRYQDIKALTSWAFETYEWR